MKIAREQAALRGSIAEMFVNVARRNHVLLSRQLSFIDQLERTEENPDTLDDLFKLDHLATRMRRNAESLIVLAGIDSGRRVRQAMPLSDVVRTAISEIEKYERVDMALRADPPVVGHVALTTAHLLAELLENATQFSNPDTRVFVVTSYSRRGVRVKITDAGLGMTYDEITDANQRIANPPVTDVVGASRLGFFVVGRLARRLDARVTLRAARDRGHGRRHRPAGRAVRARHGGRGHRDRRRRRARRVAAESGDDGRRPPADAAAGRRAPSAPGRSPAVAHGGPDQHGPPAAAVLVRLRPPTPVKAADAVPVRLRRTGRRADAGRAGRAPVERAAARRSRSAARRACRSACRPACRRAAPALPQRGTRAGPAASRPRQHRPGPGRPAPGPAPAAAVGLPRPRRRRRRAVGRGRRGRRPARPPAGPVLRLPVLAPGGRPLRTRC